MNDFKIGFVGGGNMARSLIGGLIADQVPNNHIHVSEPIDEARAHLAATFAVHTHNGSIAMTAEVDVLVLAVKPQVLREVCMELRDAVQASRPLIVSIAAGIAEGDIQRWLGGDLAIVRCMPNTPSLLQAGASGLYAGAGVSDSQRELAESVMRAVGLTMWVSEEAQIDAVTAVSGSGPAYYFLVMEAMQNAATELGLEPEAARLLTLQTALGAARMAMESDVDAGELRRRVTSPGGTTERAIGLLEEAGLREAFGRAMAGAAERSRELSEQLGKD